jgi:hypothetical protein
MLNPFTLSVILVDIKNDIAIESKVNAELMRISNKVRLNPSAKLPNKINGIRMPVIKLRTKGKLVPKNNPINRALLGIG